MYPRRNFRLLAAALICAGTVPAYAAELNVAVATRIVSFRLPATAGPISVAIIYGPGDPASEAEAASIERSIASGLTASNAKLHIRRVAAGQLGALAGVSVAFVTSGLRDKQADIAAATAKASILTATSDLSCVEAARCAVAVSSGNRMQITVSRTACKAARIQFGSAFLMLVKEVS